MKMFMNLAPDDLSIFYGEDFFMERARRWHYPRGYQPVFRIIRFNSPLVICDPPFNYEVCFGFTEQGDYKLVKDSEYVVPVEKHAGDMLNRRITGERLLFERNDLPKEPADQDQSYTINNAVFYRGYEPEIICSWQDDWWKGKEGTPSGWQVMTALCDEIDEMAHDYLLNECGILTLGDMFRLHRDRLEANREPETVDTEWKNAPTCELCGRKLEKKIFEANRPGKELQWATMCNECFKAEGGTLKYGQGNLYLKEGEHFYLKSRVKEY